MHFENWPIFDELIYFRNNLIRTLNHVDYTMLRLEIFHHVISFNNFDNYHRIYIKHNVINKSNCKKTQNSFLLIVIFSSNSSYLLWMREMIFPICLFRLFSYSSINCPSQKSVRIIYDIFVLRPIFHPNKKFRSILDVILIGKTLAARSIQNRCLMKMIGSHRFYIVQMWYFCKWTPITIPTSCAVKLNENSFCFFR